MFWSLGGSRIVIRSENPSKNQSENRFGQSAIVRLGLTFFWGGFPQPRAASRPSDASHGPSARSEVPGAASGAWGLGCVASRRREARRTWRSVK